MTGAVTGQGFDRASALGRLADEQFDVVVVGGGITGAGVALDAASRGLRTALVERDDFASGTSSRSSKFVHGGLRYVRQHQWPLVVESLVEQRRLLRNAPHLVRPLPVLLAMPGAGWLRRRGLAALLALHDRVGGTGTSRASGDGVVFHEAQVDDARLTLAVLQTAALDYGAVVANACPVVGFDHDQSAGRRARGVHLAGGVTVAARAVVNATGVWSEQVGGLEGAGSGGALRLRPAKGVHLTVAADRHPFAGAPFAGAPFAGAVVLPAVDGRGWVFATPWEGRTVLGTTDTDYDGPLDDPAVTDDDVAGLLAAVNRFLDEPLMDDDVLARWAGLRPLVAGGGGGRTADLSRRHLVAASAGGVVTVTGGKLTTYRRMAADAVDAVAALPGMPACPRSRTSSIALRGACPPSSSPTHLWQRYGSEASQVEALARSCADLARPLVPGLPYLRAEAVWAVRHEMALTLDDILSRRTRAAFLDEAATAAAAPSAAALVAPELGWTPSETAHQVATLISRLRAHPTPR